ncbi:MAG: endolytic transglycosylase MltG [Lentimicrobium sp.]|nr:endolytic transglycosylase MltG [Lentimicrobium sp.]
MTEYYHPRYSNGHSRRKHKSVKFIFLSTLLLLLIIGAAGWKTYNLFFESNVYTGSQPEFFVQIPTGSKFEDVKEILYTNGLIINRKNFEHVSKFKKYKNAVKPGRYKVTDQMGNLELVGLLRSGNQTALNVIFNNIRTPEQLASHIASQIEADSASIIMLINDSLFLDSLGVTRNSVFSILIPNTYEFYWNTSAKAFLERMKRESEKFWSGERSNLLDKIKMNRHEVITLASIVEKETNKNDEKARVAGVYMNRIKQGWLLEADPTLVFAHGDFEIKRVLNIHKLIDSPYNTYMYRGLPPGPICLPSISAIDAVLNYENHDYMFFCASDDFSGYHSFARTLEQHGINASRYRAALNRRNIYK